MEIKLRTALFICVAIFTVVNIGCASSDQSNGLKKSISTNGHYFDVNPQSGEITVVTDHAVDFYSPDNHKLIHSVEIPSTPAVFDENYLGKVTSFDRLGNQLYVFGWKDVSIIDASTYELVYSYEDTDIAAMKSCYYCITRILPAETRECCYYLKYDFQCQSGLNLLKLNIKNNEIKHQGISQRYHSAIVLNDEQTKLYATYGNSRRGWCGLYVYDAVFLDTKRDLGLAGIPSKLINGQDDEIIISYEQTGFAVLNTQTDEIVNSIAIDETIFGELVFDQKRNILYSPILNFDYHLEVFQTSMIGRIDFNNNSISVLQNNFKFGKQIALSPAGNTLYVMSDTTIHSIDLVKPD